MFFRKNAATNALELRMGFLFLFLILFVGGMLSILYFLKTGDLTIQSSNVKEKELSLIFNEGEVLSCKDKKDNFYYDVNKKEWSLVQDDEKLDVIVFNDKSGKVLFLKNCKKP